MTRTTIELSAIDLECPVSKARFVDPRVLSCGHTIDYSSLKNMQTQECPLCQKPFDSDKLPPNWTLRSIMSLGSPVKSQDAKRVTTKETVRAIADLVINAAVEKQLMSIHDEIRKAAAKGFSKIFYAKHKQFRDYLQGMHDLMQTRIEERLRAEGFTVRECYYMREWQTGIDWL